MNNPPAITNGRSYRVVEEPWHLNPNPMENRRLVRQLSPITMVDITCAITVDGYLKIYNLGNMTSVLTDRQVVQVVINSHRIITLNDEGEVIVIIRLEAEDPERLEGGWRSTAITFAGSTWYEMTVDGDIRMIASTYGSCRLLDINGQLFNLILAEIPIVTLTHPHPNDSEIIDIRYDTTVTLNGIYIGTMQKYIPRRSSSRFNILSQYIFEIDGIWTMFNGEFSVDIPCNHRSSATMVSDPQYDEAVQILNYIVDADGRLICFARYDPSLFKIVRSDILDISDRMKLSITTDGKLLLNVSIHNPEGQFLDSGIAAMCGSRVLSKPAWSRKKTIMS